MANPRPSKSVVLAVGIIIAVVAATFPSMATTVAAQEPQGAADVVPLPRRGSGTSSWDRQQQPLGSSGGIAALEPGADSSSQPLAGNTHRLHVKFSEGSAPAWTREGLDIGGAGTALGAALASESGVVVQPLFERSQQQLDAERAEAELVSGVAQPDLSAWYLVTVPSSSGGERLARRLRDVDSVEMVQPEPALAPTAPDEEEQQGYLDSSPAGIDAEWSWGRSAGTGAGVTIAVIDSGFDTNHPDLDRASRAGVAIAHEPAWDPHHGLQVLGILAGDDDNQGIRGIATGAGLRTVNSGRTSGQVANAINLASAAVGAGDVISISQGICAVERCANSIVLPLVYSSSARDALRLASARGVITVVSAGNGGANLGSYSGRLGSDAPETLVVGAGNPPAIDECAAADEEGTVQRDGAARSRVSASNYGARVDLQGWGACVRTAKQGGGYKWWGFTSAATPIVAGAAGLLSSLAEQRLGVNLTGGQVRTLLGESGRPQSSGARGGNIGPLPDVRGAVDALSRLPDNDMWAGARVIDDLPFRTQIDSRWAGVQVDEPSVACGAISHTVWYEITPGADGPVTFDTSGSDHDTMLGLWERDGNGLARITCSDDVGPNNPRSEITETLEAGQTYYLQVGGAHSAQGNIRLTVKRAGIADVGCDIDGDGYGDLVSGSPREDVRGAKDAGRSLVHFGKRNGKPRRVQRVTQEWPGLSGGSEKGDLLGQAVVCGDFNADGFDDIAVGSPGEGISGDRDAGVVRVLSGSARGLSTTNVRTISQGTRGVFSKIERDDRFGQALASGDFDGDGFDDLAIAAPGEDLGGRSDAGLVHLLHGSYDGLVLAGGRRVNGDTRGLPNSAKEGDAFGSTLAAGDFDSDGYDDLVIGAPDKARGKRDRAGAVFVLAGSRRGVTGAGSITLHQGRPGVAGGANANDRFGAALAAGDLDGDGHSDLVVGVPGEDVGGSVDAGLVHAFFGTARGLVGEGSINLHHNLDGLPGSAKRKDAFGSSVTVGDLNGDGFEDVAMAAPGKDVAAANAAGLVQILLGSPGGPDLATGRSLSQASAGVRGGPERGDHFGASLTMVDLNGDGRADLVVGIPDENAGARKNTGSILLVPGSASGADTQASSGLTQRSPKAGPNERGDRFGYALAAS